MKYCSMRKEKDFALPKDQERYDTPWQILNKENFFFFRRVPLATRKADAIPRKLYGAFEENTFLSLEIQRHGLIIWAKPIWTLFDIYTRFYLSTSPSQTRVMEFIYFTTTIFREICRCSSWKKWPLYNCFDYVDGTIAHICRLVLNKRVIYSHHKKVYGVKFQIAVFPKVLIINLEGQWEGRRHDCVLCFMNRVY